MCLKYPRPTQTDLLNRTKDSFDLENFANEVIEQPKVIDNFKRYKKNMQRKKTTMSLSRSMPSRSSSTSASKKKNRSAAATATISNKEKTTTEKNKIYI